MVRTIGVRDLARNASKVLREITRNGRPVLVTKHGEPMALITRIDHENLEDFLLSEAINEIADFAKADEELMSGKTTSLGEPEIDKESESE